MLALARTESPTTNVTLEECRDKVVERLIEAVRRACQDRDDIIHRGALWRATALLISMPGKFKLLNFAILNLVESITIFNLLGFSSICANYILHFYRYTQTIIAYGRVLADRTVHDRSHDHGDRVLAVDLNRTTRFEVALFARDVTCMAIYR